MDDWNYFKRRYSKEHWDRSKLDGVLFKQIPHKDESFLSSNFKEEEVKEVVWEGGSHKSLGLMVSILNL